MLGEQGGGDDPGGVRGGERIRSNILHEETFLIKKCLQYGCQDGPVDKSTFCTKPMT